MEQVPTPGRIRGIYKRKGQKKITDQDGNEIPLKYLNDIDLRKHYVTERVTESAVDMHEKMKDFKEEVLDLTDDLLSIRRDADDLNPTSKGGQTIYTLDKQYKITIKSGSKTIYDTDIMAQAEEAFNKFIQKKMDEGADTDVIQILQASLKKRDGDYDPRKLANLHKLKIKDEDFRRGLELSEKARDSNRTKRYMEIERRTGREGSYETVLLNVASI